VLDERGTILDPIAAVVIGDAADLPNDGAVNVPAEHALDMVALGITNDCLFVGADKTDRVLDPLFDRFTERPVAKTKDPADRVDEWIEREQKLVTKVAEEREPLDVLHHGVELVRVQDENAAPVGREVEGVFLNRDRAVGPEMAEEKFIVIPGI